MANKPVGIRLVQDAQEWELKTNQDFYFNAQEEGMEETFKE